MQTQFTTPTFGDARLPARFWNKVRVLDNGCWQWIGTKSEGYGHFGFGNYRKGTRKRERAHRWAYQKLIAPFPIGLQSDHLCRNRACVNPAHIEPVTIRENVLRGNGITARQFKQTHCIHGHLFDEANTGRRPNGGRYCRACNRRRQNDYQRRQEAS